MKYFFDLVRFKPRGKKTSTAERVRKNDADELRIPKEKNLFLLVAARDIDSDKFEATAQKLKIISAIQQSNFEYGASRLESTEEWFRVVPADWIVSEFKPVLERLPIKESIKQTIRQSKKFVKIQVSEQFDSTLSNYQLLNFATAQFAINVQGILFEPCSFKLYHFKDWQIKDFSFVESNLPSMSPFLSVLSSREGERYRLTSHGLARFDLPELQLDNVHESLSGPSVYLINAIAQSLIEGVVQSKTKHATILSLEEPLAVSTAAVIRGNYGNLPFQSCIPRAADLRLSLRKHNGTIKLFACFGGDWIEQDAALRDVLAKLSLLQLGCDAMRDGS